LNFCKHYNIFKIKIYKILKMNNIKPRSRTNRNALNQRDLIEKDNIDRRIGWEARHVNAGSLIH